MEAIGSQVETVAVGKPSSRYGIRAGQGPLGGFPRRGWLSPPQYLGAASIQHGWVVIIHNTHRSAIALISTSYSAYDWLESIIETILLIYHFNSCKL